MSGTTTEYFYVAGVPYLRRQSEVEVLECWLHPEASGSIRVEFGMFFRQPGVAVYVIALLVRYQTWGKAIVTTHKQKATDAFAFLRRYAHEHAEELLRPKRLEIGRKASRAKKRRRKTGRR